MRKYIKNSDGGWVSTGILTAPEEDFQYKLYISEVEAPNGYYKQVGPLAEREINLKNGYATFNNIAFGTYVVKEIAALDG